MHSVTLFISTLLSLLLFIQSPSTVQGRLEPITYFSDPIEILMRDSYSTRQPAYKYRRSRTPSTYRTVSKRRYNAYPPSFYTSSYNSYPLNFNRRSAGIPYADLFFSG